MLAQKGKSARNRPYSASAEDGVSQDDRPSNGAGVEAALFEDAGSSDTDLDTGAFDDATFDGGAFEEGEFEDADQPRRGAGNRDRSSVGLQAPRRGAGASRKTKSKSSGRAESTSDKGESTGTMQSHNTASEPPFAADELLEDTSVRYSPAFASTSEAPDHMGMIRRFDSGPPPASRRTSSLPPPGSKAPDSPGDSTLSRYFRDMVIH
jgi:hypothetical protein